MEGRIIKKKALALFLILELRNSSIVRVSSRRSRRLSTWAHLFAIQVAKTSESDNVTVPRFFHL